MIKIWRLLGLVAGRLPLWPEHGDHFHFVRDYRRMVRLLLARYPRDEAMSLAVGGDYEVMGRFQAAAMIDAGLADGMALLDLGCGSGRLASALSRRVQIEYLGLDIIPELLNYARSQCPPDYRFLLNRHLSLPVKDEYFDFVSAFSLFTHLLHEETFIYLTEVLRVLKPGGVVVFSFLEFGAPNHWPSFATTVASAKENRRGHLNVFIERSVIVLWAEKLGFDVEALTGVGEPGAAGRIGQSVAVLRRR